MGYLFAFIAALIVDAIFLTLLYLEGEVLNPWAIVGSVIFATAFFALVIRKIKLFDAYFQSDSALIYRKTPDLATRKATPVLVSLLVGGLIALSLFILKVDGMLAASLVGALTAGMLCFGKRH